MRRKNTIDYDYDYEHEHDYDYDYDYDYDNYYETDKGDPWA